MSQEYFRALAEVVQQTVSMMCDVDATVVDARITESALAVNQTVTARFTEEQAFVLTGHMELLIEIVDPAGAVVAGVRGAVTRKRGLMEGATLRERDGVLFEMTEDMAVELNRALDDAIPRHLAEHLR